MVSVLKEAEVSQFLFKETLDNANIFRKLAFPNVSLNKNWETSDSLKAEEKFKAILKGFIQ